MNSRKNGSDAGLLFQLSAASDQVLSETKLMRVNIAPMPVPNVVAFAPTPVGTRRTYASVMLPARPAKSHLRYESRLSVAPLSLEKSDVFVPKFDAGFA